MPCAITPLSSSPIFTPSPRNSSPIFCKSATSPRSPSLSSPLPLSLKQIRNNGVEEEEAGPSRVATVSKRKRPARIDIPVESLWFDAVKKTPPDLDRSSEVEVEGEWYSVYCKRGKRGGVMEDRFTAVLGLEGDPKQAFFGVFDGHGGPGAAEFAAKTLEKNVMYEVYKRSNEMIESAVKEGYLTTDHEFLKEDIRGGTCCVTALIYKGDLVVSNAGDCRAVMSRGGVAEALTMDHRPSRDDERERIMNMGGYVDCSHGVWRVHGSLAVSRAIGDSHLKQWVIAEPETKLFKIEPECEFLILASDGLWDNVSNQEAVDMVRSLCNGVDKPGAFSACEKLVELSLSRGSADDITVMIIQLTHFISPCVYFSFPCSKQITDVDKQ